MGGSLGRHHQSERERQASGPRTLQQSASSPDVAASLKSFFLESPRESTFFASPMGGASNRSVAFSNGEDGEQDGEEAEQRRKRQQLVAKQKVSKHSIEFGLMQPRRSRFEERYESGAPKLLSSRIVRATSREPSTYWAASREQSGFYEPSGLFFRQIGGKFSVDDIPICSSPPPEEFDARPTRSRRSSSASGAAQSRRASLLMGLPPRSGPAWSKSAPELPDTSATPAAATTQPAESGYAGRRVRIDLVVALAQASAAAAARDSRDSFCLRPLDMDKSGSVRERDQGSFTWRCIEKRESLRAGSPRARASVAVALQGLRPEGREGSPVRGASHSVPIVQMHAPASLKDARVGTVGSARPYAVTWSGGVEEASTGRQQLGDRVPSLPGGHDMWEEGDRSVSNSSSVKHRNSASVLAVVECTEEEAAEVEDGQQQQQEQPRAWRSGDGAARVSGNGLYTPFKLKKQASRGEGALA